tara:strand:- start:338 stop:649 length:312 start_codon:yes stop_codon:yes gene_type:complete
MSEVKTRKVRKMTNLGKVGKMIPIMTIVAVPLSTYIQSQRFANSSIPSILIGGAALGATLGHWDQTPKKKRTFSYSKNLDIFEELVLWTTAFTVIDLAIGRQG